MKKFLAVFLTFIYCSINACFAFSEVYYVKNTSVEDLKATVKNAFYSQDYNVEKQDPYYGKSIYDPSKYAVVILQQSGNNLFYYYNSNENKKINKYILKMIKKSDLEYEQSFNANIIDVYDNLANRIISSNVNNSYIFTDDEPIVSNTSTPKTYQTTNTNTLKGYVATIQSGTKINIYLQNSINTANAVQGDAVTAVVSKDLTYNGKSVIPQGSVVYGTLKKAHHATYGSRNGRVIIDFNQIVTPDGKTYNISAEEIDFKVTNEGKIASVGKNVLTGALIGGLAGLLIGAMSKDFGKAVAITAGIGATTAAVTNVAEMGVDAEIPSFTEMEIILTKPFTASINY